MTPLLLILLAVATTTSATRTAVYDIDGHPVKANTNYYILPVIRGRGGGLTMDTKINSSFPCPLYVAQEDQEVSQGLPIKLLPVNPKQKTVSLSVDQNFMFDAFTTCVQSTVWRLTLNETSGRRYVATAGQQGNPGFETVNNWFKVEKAGTGKYDYKIVFCPSVCSICRVVCGDVGVFIEDGKRWLGLSDQPLLVMFKKEELVGSM